MNHQNCDNRTRQYLSILGRNALLGGPAQALYPRMAEDVVQGRNLLVFCPVMNAYVIWILREAVRCGIKRLYFLARDGYLVCQTARQYCEKLGLDVECRYLHCSRFSLRMPLYHRNFQDALDYICRGGLSVTGRQLMVRAGFSEADIDEIYPQTGLPYALEDLIPYSQLMGPVREKLNACEAFRQRVCRNSEAAFPAMEGYFRQEGLLDDVPMALVDCGWTGSMQKSIQQTQLLLGGKNRISGFYFGLYYLMSKEEASRLHCFYFSPYRHLDRKVRFNNNLLEVVFSAPHGTTCGYCRTEGGFGPILGGTDSRISTLINHISGQLTDYTALVLEQLTAEGFFALDVPELARLSARLLKPLMWAPTTQEAEAYGVLPFSDDVLDTSLQPLAVRMSQEHLRHNHFSSKFLVKLGMRQRPYWESAWYEASAVRSGPHRWHRWSYGCYKALVYLIKMVRH